MRGFLASFLGEFHGGDTSKTDAGLEEAAELQQQQQSWSLHVQETRSLWGVWEEFGGGGGCGVTGEGGVGLGRSLQQVSGVGAGVVLGGRNSGGLALAWFFFPHVRPLDFKLHVLVRVSLVHAGHILTEPNMESHLNMLHGVCLPLQGRSVNCLKGPLFQLGFKVNLAACQSFTRALSTRVPGCNWEQTSAGNVQFAVDQFWQKGVGQN